MANETELRGISGWAAIVGLAVVGVAAVFGLIRVDEDWMRAAAVGVLIIDVALLAGLTVVNPNQASVVTLFGVYKGTIKRPGLWWVNPLTSRRKLSLRVR